MADIKYHEYQDRLGDNPLHKHLDEAELRARADLRRQDLDNTKKWMDSEIDISEFEDVPREGLAAAEHYGKMEDVEIDPEVSTFWQTLQDGLTNPKERLAEGKKEYEAAYVQWQDLLESMDDRRRDELGVNNIEQRIKQAKEGVKQSKQSLAESKQRLAELQYSTNPLKAVFGFIVGDNREMKTIHDAYKGVESARKAVKQSRMTLQQVLESRAALEEKKASLSVKEYTITRKMSDAQFKIANAREDARQIIEGGKNGTTKASDVQARLQQQYDLIEKYKAIQALRNSNQYQAIRARLTATNPELLEQLDKLPDTMPSKAFKVTLNGPLQLPAQGKKIETLDKKISELQAKLPTDAEMAELQTKKDGINAEISAEETKQNDLKAKRDELKLKDTDTIESLDAQLVNPDITDEERKQLTMKKEHLELQAKLDAKKEEIRVLTAEIKDFTGSDKDLQPKLRDLKTKKDHLKVLEEELAKDSYSQALGNIETEITKSTTKTNDLRQQLTGLEAIEAARTATLEKIKELTGEKTNAEALLHIDTMLPTLSEGLDGVHELGPTQTESTFRMILNRLEEAARKDIEQLAIRKGKEPKKIPEHTGPNQEDQGR